MRGNVPVSSPENMAYRVQLLAEIGRRLREAYHAEQRLPDRLAELMRRIDQLPEGQFEQARSAAFDD